MSFGDLVDRIKGAGKAVVEFLSHPGNTFAALLGFFGWIVPAFGCLAGTAGYWYASAWVNSRPSGSDRRRLTKMEKAVFAEVLEKTTFAADLDKVWLRTGINLGGIPGNPGGLTLGDSVYLTGTLRECDTKDDEYYDVMAVLLHELVHVAQYQEKGRARFACEYGTSITKRFSADIPIEKAAYEVQYNHDDDLRLAINRACADKKEEALAAAGPGSDWFWVVWS